MRPAPLLLALLLAWLLPGVAASFGLLPASAWIAYGGVLALAADERITEIARMLGGLEFRPTR